MKAVTAVVLFLALAFQAGCYTQTAGPTGPIAPDDSTAIGEIERGGRIRVTTVSGTEYDMKSPQISEAALTGLAVNTTPRGTFQYATIPLDSIAQVRVVELDVLRTTIAVLLVGGVVAGGLLAAMLQGSGLSGW